MANEQTTQKETFLNSEGNQWYERNKNSLNNTLSDPIVKALQNIKIAPEKVLEIGCSNGMRLNLIEKTFKSKCFGIDPSSKAIEQGTKRYQNIKLNVGTAEKLKFEDNYFDMIIFGFCLYLCDRNDLFKIAFEADRCLKNDGYIVIKDFFPPLPFKNQYTHKEGVYSYKMKYSKLFTWNPAYNEIFLDVFSHDGYTKRTIPNEKVAISILYKNIENAFPTEIYKKC